MGSQPIDTAQAERRDRLYAQACATHGPAIARIARSSEADRELSRDLEQEIHLALWRSFERFDGRCAVGTWIWRVAHNVAADHALRGRRTARWASLDEAAAAVAADDPERSAGDAQLTARLRAMIARLAPAERGVILLYLEGVDAAGIAAVTGLSPGNVAVKVHRIKAVLATAFAVGEPA